MVANRLAQRYYNKTRYAGLENHIPNSYANAILQLMNYTPLLRNMALQHAATACVSDLCLLCELGFVFDMLQKAEGSTCQATNMFKALAATPQGSSSFHFELTARLTDTAKLLLWA
jgi:PAB-dependent poly(A)-specific ribonuclease subunit 2